MRRRTRPTSRPRCRPVEAALEDHLDRYTGADPGALVFPGPTGGPLRLNGWRHRFWVPALAKAGLGHVRPHDLRHTAVTLWIAAGASPKQVATWAGHTSVAVVLDRYAHLFPGNEDPIRERITAVHAAAKVPTSAEVVKLELVSAAGGPEIPPSNPRPARRRATAVEGPTTL